MDKLSLKKKLYVIRLYMEGMSYDEIAAKANISKGTVFNIITELRLGYFPEYGDLSEQLELLRELAVDLRRSRITPLQAAVGISVLSRLQELGVEPNEIEVLSGLCRTLTAEGTDIQSFIRTGLLLKEVQKSTGLSLDDLESKVKDLEESVSQLEPLAKEAAEREVELAKLEEKRQSFTEKVANLEKRYSILQDNVKQKERRETVLSNRVKSLEDRAESADERLTVSRGDLKILSGLGISPDNLTAFSQRIKIIAQCHSMKSETLYSRLMDELEQMDEGLGLDTVIKARKDELDRLETNILKAKEESERISATNEKLRQERTALKAALSEGRRHFVTDIGSINTVVDSAITELKQNLDTAVREGSIEIDKLRNKGRKTLETVMKEERRHAVADMKAIGTLVDNTVTSLKKNLGDGVSEGTFEINRLRNQALMLGKELGQFNEMIESNKWLKGLSAMVKGDEKLEPCQVRVIGITLMRAMHTWLEHYAQNNAVPYSLRSWISNTIGELEKWKL